MLPLCGTYCSSATSMQTQTSGSTAEFAAFLQERASNRYCCTVQLSQLPREAFIASFQHILLLGSWTALW